MATHTVIVQGYSARTGAPRDTGHTVTDGAELLQVVQAHHPDDRIRVHVRGLIVQVTTPYGDRYHIDTTSGRLLYIRKQGPKTLGSTQWTITGISPTDQRFGRTLPGGLAALAELVSRPAGELLTSKGKPKYTLCDLDHGTSRVHGNTEVHGIQSVRKLPDDYQLPTEGD